VTPDERKRLRTAIEEEVGEERLRLAAQAEAAALRGFATAQAKWLMITAVASAVVLGTTLKNEAVAWLATFLGGAGVYFVVLQVVALTRAQRAERRTARPQGASGVATAVERRVTGEPETAETERLL